MRVTSIRSLPDAGIDEDLKDLDETVREHLTRDHVVSTIFTNQTLEYFSSSKTAERRSFICLPSIA